MFKNTTFHGSWSISTLKEVQIWEKLYAKCSTAPLLNGTSSQNCQINEKMSVQQSPTSNGHNTSDL